jgi:glycosyltransferase involved in cell wall biosynthesis
MTRPLRIAYVVASLRPGGAERQMLALAELLPHERFQVDFLVLSGPGEYDQRGTAAGATVRHVGSAPPANASLPSKVVRRIAKTATFIQTARAGRYDIIDAWLYPSDVLTALTRRLTHATVIVSGRRNLDPHETFGPAGAMIDAVTLRQTDMVVANSAAAAEYALAHEPLDRAKVRIIRNGVKLISPLETEDRVARRRALGVGDRELLIGCVANYLPVKRHEMLIDAFASVAQRFPAARLALIGEGPMRHAIESRERSQGLGQRVRLVGSVADPTPTLGAFDVAVQSSRSEGLPNALLEAAAAGRPIVATDAGGTGEIVLDGETGLLVRTEDADALASALIRALSDSELRTRLGGAAREHAATVFGMGRFASEFADLYLELALTRGIRA